MAGKVDVRTQDGASVSCNNPTPTFPVNEDLRLPDGSVRTVLAGGIDVNTTVRLADGSTAVLST